MGIGDHNKRYINRKVLIRQALFWSILALFLLANLPKLLRNPSTFVDSAASPVIITEFLARNQTGLVDNEGGNVDWIELHNRSDRPVNLEGWSLTDNAATPDKWRFPAVVLPVQGYLVVYASGKKGVTWPDREADPASLPMIHTNFRINGAAGFLALYPPTTRRFLDSYAIRYGPQRVDVSYGRILGEMADANGEIPYYFCNRSPPPAD